MNKANLGNQTDQLGVIWMIRLNETISSELDSVETDFHAPSFMFRCSDVPVAV